MSKEIEGHLPLTDADGKTTPVCKVWRERAWKAEGLLQELSNIWAHGTKTLEDSAELIDKLNTDLSKVRDRRDKWRKLAEEERVAQFALKLERAQNSLRNFRLTNESMREKWNKDIEERDVLRNLSEEYKKMWNEESDKADAFQIGRQEALDQYAGLYTEWTETRAERDDLQLCLRKHHETIYQRSKVGLESPEEGECNVCGMHIESKEEGGA